MARAALPPQQLICPTCDRPVGDLTLKVTFDQAGTVVTLKPTESSYEEIRAAYRAGDHRDCLNT